MTEQGTSTSICRLCAKTDFSVNIFGELGLKQNLYTKIKQCLPIQVTEGDTLPTCVCLNCITKLNTSYELHTTSVSVQSQIHKIVTAAKNKESAAQQNTPEKTMTNFCLTIPYSKDVSDQLVNTVYYRVSDPLQYKTVWQFPQGIPVQYAPEKGIDGSSHPTEVVGKNSTTVQQQDSLCNLSIQSVCTLQEDKRKRDRKTVCRYCLKWFPRSIIEHHENLHIKGGKIYSCVVCNNNFRTKQEFRSHNCETEAVS